MQLILVVFCSCVTVQSLATGTENTFQETDTTTGPELGVKSEPQSAKYGRTGEDVVLAPSPFMKLLNGSAREVLEQNSDSRGRTQMSDDQQQLLAGSGQLDGDARLKRSPHRHFKGCYFCGGGGGGGGGGYYPQPVYVQPVYAKPVYVQPVYVKPVVYTQPVYQKPVYSQPYYTSGCSTCGHGGGGSGSYSYSQSSASSSSYSYGYGKK